MYKIDMNVTILTIKQTNKKHYNAHSCIVFYLNCLRVLVYLRLKKLTKKNPIKSKIIINQRDIITKIINKILIE